MRILWFSLNGLRMILVLLVKLMVSVLFSHVVVLGGLLMAARSRAGTGAVTETVTEAVTEAGIQAESRTVFEH